MAFVLGKGCALQAGKEHRQLQSIGFNLQFLFLHDDEGQIFIRYFKDICWKTNKGGLKHRKVDPKQVGFVSHST